jgi:thiol-disulfide isomerase/thioredoxin
MASQLAKNMEAQIKAAADDAAALQLVRQFVSQTDDIEDLRMLQNHWLSLSPEEGREYFAGLLAKHPSDPKYIYLKARASEDIKEQMQAGRLLVKKYPGFEYGYRLLLAYYPKNLFIYRDGTVPEAQPYLKDFNKDKKYFAQYLKKFPANENALYLNISLLVWERKVKEANAMLAVAVDKNASWLSWQFYTEFYFKTGQYQMLETYIRRLVDTSDATKGMSDAEKEQQVAAAYLGTLFDGQDYKEMFAYVKSHPAALQEVHTQRIYLLASVYTGELERAFNFLSLLSTQSGDLFNWLTSEADLEPLRKDARWDKLMEQFSNLWVLSTENRRTEAVARKLSKPAPLWQLQDAKGDTVRLSDLRGEVIVLDFWATWCGPCKMAMPVLDKWMKNRMPGGVKVFSINVWENAPDKAAAFITDNKYAMTLLYGTPNISKDYGFDGIPYLCVIDRDGNIRYEEKGYADDLGENLAFWVDDLLMPSH